MSDSDPTQRAAERIDSERGMTDPVDAFREKLGNQKANTSDTSAGGEGADMGDDSNPLRRFREKLRDHGVEHKADWAPYEGPQGGSGWKNMETGEVSYADEAPGSAMDEEQLREEAATELVEMDSISEDAMRAFAEDHSVSVSEDDSELEVAQTIADEAPTNVLANALGGQDPTQVADTVHGEGVSTTDVGEVYEVADNAGVDGEEVTEALESVAEDNGLDPDNEMEVATWLNDNDEARQEALEQAVPEPDGGEGGDGDDIPTVDEMSGMDSDQLMEVNDRLGSGMAEETVVEAVDEGRTEEVAEEILDNADAPEDAELANIDGDNEGGTPGPAEFDDETPENREEARERGGVDGGGDEDTETVARNLIDGRNFDEVWRQNMGSESPEDPGMDDARDLAESLSDEEREAFLDMNASKADDPTEKARRFIESRRGGDEGNANSPGVERKEWIPYSGPQGGDGWKNLETGDVSYDDDPPGGMADPDEISDEDLEAFAEAEGVDASADEIREAMFQEIGGRETTGGGAMEDLGVGGDGDQGGDENAMGREEMTDAAYERLGDDWQESDVQDAMVDMSEHVDDWDTSDEWLAGTMGFDYGDAEEYFDSPSEAFEHAVQQDPARGEYLPDHIADVAQNADDPQAAFDSAVGDGGGGEAGGDDPGDGDDGDGGVVDPVRRFREKLGGDE